MANFKSKQWEWKGEKFDVLPGQFITSLESIVSTCGTGIKIQNVRTALVRFEKLDFLTNESTKTGRLITIANWSVYQCDDEAPNIAANKDLTKTSQRPNKDLTPREERKNVKKVKKENISVGARNKFHDFEQGKSDLSDKELESKLRSKTKVV